MEKVSRSGVKTGSTAKIRRIDIGTSRVFKCISVKEMGSVCAMAYRLNMYNERNGVKYRCRRSINDLTVTITAELPKPKK